MLIAQAQVENLHIMTADPQFALYGVPLLRAGRGVDPARPAAAGSGNGP